MKVAVVHSFYSSAQPSGENQVVLDQVEYLRRAGHDVLVVDRHTDETKDAVLFSSRAGLTAASGIGASPATVLRRFVPDVVHLHNTFPNWGPTWLRVWGPRTVVTLHN